MRAVVDRWRWLIGFVALMTILAGVFVVRSEREEYVSTGTYLVRADAPDENDLIRATANLSGAKINFTFAYTIESDLIKSRAQEKLESANMSGVDFDVTAVVVPNSNIIAISGRSADPAVAFEAAQAAGAESVAYVNDLDGIYDLVVLDSPEFPTKPVAPGLSPFVLGGILVIGLSLGLGVGFAAEAFFPQKVDGPGGVAPHGTGLNDEAYTRRRYHEEVARTDYGGDPFELAVLQLEVPVRGPDHLVEEIVAPDAALTRRVARAIEKTLRDYDHLGHLGDMAPGSLALILPGLTDEETREAALQWKAAALSRLGRTYLTGAHVSVSLCRYEGHKLSGDTRAREIARAL